MAEKDKKNKTDIVREAALSLGGEFGAADVVMVTGLSKKDVPTRLANLAKTGVLERVRAGVYRVPDEKQPIEAPAVQVVLEDPDFIRAEAVCGDVGAIYRVWLGADDIVMYTTVTMLSEHTEDEVKAAALSKVHVELLGPCNRDIISLSPIGDVERLA